MAPVSLLPFADLLGKSLLLLALVFAATGLVRISAARRHCLWLAVFVALLLLPLTKFAHPLWTLSFEKAESTPVVAASMPPVAFAERAAGDSIQMPVTTKWRLPSGTETAIFIWGLGALLLLGSRLPGRFALNRLLRGSCPATEGLAEVVARVSADFSVRADVRVSQECRVPMTWGTFRPVVLLPIGAKHWSDERLSAALRHEYAHIVRHDFLSRRLACVVRAIYWPNPLVWLAVRHWRLVQEMACDDVVLQNGAAAPEYAGQLVDVARDFLRPTGGRHTLAMAQPCTLELRVKAVLDARRDRRAAGRRTWLALAAAMTAMLLASALAQTGETPSDALQAVPELSDAAPLTKAKKIIIPKFEVSDVSMAKAVDDLRRLSVQLDSEPDPGKRGVNIFILLPKGQAAPPNVTLKVEKVPLAEALGQLAKLCGYELMAGDQVLTLTPAGSMPKLSTTVYTVPADKRSVFAGRNAEELKQMFEAAGIPFNQGARVTFEKGGALSVTNTAEAHRAIRSIFERDLLGALRIPPRPSPDSIEARASAIRLPRVYLREATLPEALDALSKLAVEADPKKKGVMIVLQPAAKEQAADRRVTLELSNVELLEAVKYVAVADGLTARVGDRAIVVETAADASRLVTREYKVDARFLAEMKDDAALKKFFAENGVEFPPGATIWKTRAGFAMRNTEAQHTALGGMLESPASQQSGVIKDDAKVAR